MIIENKVDTFIKSFSLPLSHLSLYSGCPPTFSPFCVDGERNAYFASSRETQGIWKYKACAQTLAISSVDRVCVR